MSVSQSTGDQIGARAGQRASASPRPRANTVLSAATIFLSAFLLFQVQPLITKFILPWFGGSAAVWSAALLFFQLLLLGGYAYAHGLMRCVGDGWQRVVHLGLLAVSFALLPILPSPEWKPSGADDPTLRILMALAVTVGLPYFLLSATSPLLQAWYARCSGTSMPYRLFALSNFGSLLGLASFPFFVEPHLTSRQQAYTWSAAYVVFALLCGAAAWTSRQERAIGIAMARTAPPSTSVGQLALWVGLAMCPSTLLLSVTHQLTQNVAPIPLLWVLPLGTYLATFILAFESDRVYRRSVMLPLLALAIGIMAYLAYAGPGKVPLRLAIPAFILGLFVCCLTCHGELARRRPPAGSLTLFYLAVAIGGALGGTFVALVAPRVFRTYLELPIGLVACAIVAIAVAWNVKIRLIGSFVPRLAMICCAAVLVLFLSGQEYLDATKYSLTVRNFYGVLRVYDYHPGIRMLVNGTIVHGAQLIGSRRYVPTAYYGPNSGVGRALRALEARGRVRVGIIGLGAGVLSAYGRPRDVYRFYEINPLDVQLAQTAFTFYTHSPADKGILLGDARLVLEREVNQEFDLLVVDAFSSDAIPIHLVTREALGVYIRLTRRPRERCALACCVVQLSQSRWFASPREMSTGGHGLRPHTPLDLL